MTSGWRWMDKASGGGQMMEDHPVRRVQGIHEIRFDGLSDLLLRAHGASVFDVGCNRGHLLWDFAMNGARLAHGCDLDRPSILIARGWFAEHPHIESKFEIVDLRDGRKAVSAAFNDTLYDIVLFIGVQHKLKRVMPGGNLSELITYLGSLSKVYFGWNGYAEDIKQMDEALHYCGLKRVHTSELRLPGRPAAIWKRS